MADLASVLVKRGASFQVVSAVTQIIASGDFPTPPWTLEALSDGAVACVLQRSSLTTKINFKSFMIIYSCIHSFHSIEAKITNQLIHLIDAERLNNTT